MTFPGWRPAGIEQALLRYEHERTIRRLTVPHGAFGSGDLGQRAAYML